jgi:hypothetical protein
MMAVVVVVVRVVVRTVSLLLGGDRLIHEMDPSS